MVRIEIACDVRPKGKSDTERLDQLELIYSHVTSNLWAFDAQGVQRAFRTHRRGGMAIPFAYNGPEGLEVEGVDLPMFRSEPDKSETVYYGHDFGFVGASSALPNCAQIKVYRKERDQITRGKKESGTTIPLNRQTIRIEANIGSEGLRYLRLAKTSDLVSPAFSFRAAFSPYFRLLDQQSILNASMQIRKPKAGATRSLKLAAVLMRAKRSLAAGVLSQGGVSGFVGGAFSNLAGIDKRSRDAKANRKVGEALDNLSKAVRRV